MCGDALRCTVAWRGVMAQAQEYLTRVEPRPPTNLQERYHGASDDSVDLLRRMLAFFPEDRISTEDAIKHPFFAPIRQPASEVCAACGRVSSAARVGRCGDSRRVRCRFTATTS
jgi:hypothetical protein